MWKSSLVLRLPGKWKKSLCNFCLTIMSLSHVAFILPVQSVRDGKSFKVLLFTESLSNTTPQSGRFHELQTPCWQMEFVTDCLMGTVGEAIGKQQEKNRALGFLSSEVTPVTSENSFQCFSVALLSWYWWWSFNRGRVRRILLLSYTVLYRCCCYQQLGAGFQELLAFHQARASRRGRRMRWGLLHLCRVSPVDNADLVSKAKMICLKIQMPCTE